MKQQMRRWSAVVLLLFLISLMCACSPGGTDEPQHGESDEPQEPTVEPEQIRVTGNRHDGPYLEYGAKTGTGYYELLNWPDELGKPDDPLTKYGNILYTDYSSAQRIFLCNVPGCAHNTSSCHSFLDYSGSCVLFTDCSESKLFVMSGGDVSLRYTDESQLPRILQMDKDGGNRKELLRLEANEYFSLNSVIVAGDEHLYTCISRVEKTGADVKTVKELVRISLADGSREHLMDLNEMWDSLTSEWENEDLIVSHVDPKTYEMFLWRVGTDGELLETFGPYNVQTLYYDSEILLAAEMTSGGCAVERIDLKKDGEITGRIEIPADPAGMLFCNQYDGGKAHLLFSVNAGSSFDTKEYLLDFDQEKYSELTLEYEEDGTLRKVGALGAAGDSYFVICGVEDGQIILTDKDGIPHEYAYPRYQRALIQKQDYWNNLANYRLITDRVSSDSP